VTRESLKACSPFQPRIRPSRPSLAALRPHQAADPPPPPDYGPSYKQKWTCGLAAPPRELGVPPTCLGPNWRVGALAFPLRIGSTAGDKRENHPVGCKHKFHRIPHDKCCSAAANSSTICKILQDLIVGSRCLTRDFGLDTSIRWTSCLHACV